MITTLQPGDIFRIRRNYDWEYCVVDVMPESHRQKYNFSVYAKVYGIVRYSNLPKGTVIHECVWKKSGTELVVRKKIVKKEDATVPLTEQEKKDALQEREDAFREHMKQLDDSRKKWKNFMLK